MNVPALGRLNSVGSYGWSGAATTTFSVDPEEQLTYVILAQLMPNDTALMQRGDAADSHVIQTLGYSAPARKARSPGRFGAAHDVRPFEDLSVVAAAVSGLAAAADRRRSG